MVMSDVSKATEIYRSLRRKYPDSSSAPQPPRLNDGFCDESSACNIIIIITIHHHHQHPPTTHVPTVTKPTKS